MLRRLSAQSQQIIRQAEGIAREYAQDYVDGEHVLLAIAQAKGSRAGQLLRDGGATPETLRKSIQPFIKEPPQETFVVGRLPGTMHFKNVVARSIEIAESRKAAAVEPEDLLLALSHEQNSLAVQALQTCGLDAGRIQQMLST